MNPRHTLLLIVMLVIVSLILNAPKLPFNLQIPNTPINLNQFVGNFPLRLGLDLQGGTQLVLETKMDQIEEGKRDQALESAKEVIERRVNLYGVSESQVQTARVEDRRRILVEMPGVQDASAAAQLVGSTAQLDFREPPASFSAEATSSGIPLIYFFEPTGLTGDDVESASVVFGQSNEGGGAQVSLKFNSEGAKKFGEITQRNVGNQVAIFLDQYPVMDPVVNQPILDGNAIISGGFTTEQAKQLSVQLNAGALPVPIEIVEHRSIGATLGQESVNKSIIAGAVGLMTVIIFMIFYYGWLGVIASIALLIYSLFVLTIFTTGLWVIPPVTMTLAGIAGFILSIGMAVDANILVFERMKEEIRWGKSKRVAVDQGFKRAWSSIRDSNISTLITAAILFYFGSGLVKGFALTLAIGVLVSMFTAITVTKTILKLMYK